MEYSRFYILCWLLMSIVLKLKSQPASADTVYSKNNLSGKNKLEAFLASSLFFNDNWKGTFGSSFIIAASLNVSFNTENTGKCHLLELKGDINYQKFLDSIWIKNNDKLFITSTWIEKQGLIKKSIQISFKTQFTNTWEYPLSKNDNRIWKSGPLLPFTINCGYGFNKKFLNSSYLNISILSTNIESMPRSELTLSDDNILAVMDKLILKSEYGINVQINLLFKLTKNISWENKTIAFSEFQNIKEGNFEMQNTFSITPFRFMKIRMTNNLVYEILISPKIQWRQELLVGFSFEK